MKITVYGSGCPTCKKLFEITQKAAIELDKNQKVEYIAGQNGIQKIIELGAMSSPVIAVDGKLAFSGFTSNLEIIKAAILKASKGV